MDHLRDIKWGASPSFSDTPRIGEWERVHCLEDVVKVGGAGEFKYGHRSKTVLNPNSTGLKPPNFKYI
jgi:hypothetical protein